MKLKVDNKFYDFIENFSIVFLSLTILPFLVLSIYIHPNWDDYQFYCTSTELGIWKAQYYWYHDWSGAFFSIGLQSVFNPLLYNSLAGYKILPVILITGFLISCYYFINEFTAKLISGKQIVICVLIFSSLYFFKMADVAHQFYYMASSFKYGISNILMIILFTVLLKFFKEENHKKKLLERICIFVLLISIVGSSEISLVMLLTVLFLIFTIYYIINRKINWEILFFLTVSITAFLIVYFSPGNEKHAAAYPKKESIRLFFYK